MNIARSIQSSWAALLEGLPIFPLGSALISRLSVYVSLILAARLLDGEEFGLFAILIALIGILSALVSGGGDMWLNRFSWQSSAAGRQAPRLWPVYLSLVTMLAASVTALATLIDFSFPAFNAYEWVIFTAILTAAIIGITEAFLAIVRASGSIHLFFSIRDVVAPLLFLIVILALRPRSAGSLINLYLILSTITCVVLGLWLIWRAPATLPAVRPPRAAWRPVALHTGGLIFGNLTSRLAVYIDAFVLAAFVPMTLLGEYRVAAQFAVGFMVAQHFVFLGLPWQMRLTGELGRARIAHIAVLQRQRLFVMLGALTLGLLWLFTDVVLGLLGERFLGMANVFRLLLIIRFTSLLWGPQHEVLVSSGFGIHDGVANMVSLLTWLCSFYVLANYLEAITSAIIANTISAAAGHLYRYVVMTWNNIPGVYGHPFGIFLPLAIYVIVLWSAAGAAV